MYLQTWTDMNIPDLLQEKEGRELGQVPAASRAPSVTCSDAIRGSHSTMHKQAMGSPEPLNSYSPTHHKPKFAFQESPRAGFKAGYL